jgi:hypothetical protein
MPSPVIFMVILILVVVLIFVLLMLSIGVLCRMPLRFHLVGFGLRFVGFALFFTL